MQSITCVVLVIAACVPYVSALSLTISPDSLWPAPVNESRLYGMCSCSLLADVAQSNFTFKITGQQSAILSEAIVRHTALIFAWETQTLNEKLRHRFRGESRRPPAHEKKSASPKEEEPTANPPLQTCSYSVPNFNTYLGLCADNPRMYPCPRIPTLAAAMAHCDTLPLCGGITKSLNSTDYEARVGPDLGPSGSGETSWVKICSHVSVGALIRMEVNVTGTGATDYPRENMDESYTLIVPSGTAGQPIVGSIVANSVWGALRGLQTFSQLVQYNYSSNLFSVQPIAVTDYPRFPFRGVMIDTSRRFITVPTILSILDGMEWNKMNVLHLHLTDDQSWPLVLPSLPRLSQLGAWTSNNHRFQPSDIANIVNYAAARGIRIIPEVDTPGHDSVIAMAYPEVIVNGILDPTNNQTWQLLGALIGDIVNMFPDHSFFIGGDETDVTAWNTSAIRAWMKQNNIPNLTDLAVYYNNRLIGMLAAAGRSSIAWSPGVGDIPGVANITHSVWYGYMDGWQSAMQQVTTAGHPAVLSGPWYVIVADQRLPDEYNSLWQFFYTTDPQNYTGTAQAKQMVKGGECVVWDDNTSYDSSTLVSGIFPMCSAVAEMLWTPQVQTNQNGGTSYESSRSRMVDQRCRMVGRGLPAKAPIMINPLEEQIGYCPIEFSTTPPSEVLEMRLELARMIAREEARAAAEREL